MSVHLLKIKFVKEVQLFKGGHKIMEKFYNDVKMWVVVVLPPTYLKQNLGIWSMRN